MAIYLDASCLVSIFAPEAETHAVLDYVENAGDLPLLSDFGAGEVASAISRKTREGSISVEQGHAVLAAFDVWALDAASLVEVSSSDLRRAVAIVRRFDLKLRMPDALHVAMAEARSAILITRDRAMAAAAAALHIDVVSLN